MTGLPVNSWSPDDVAGWLGSEGLGAVAGTFRANGVSGADLAIMSYEDIVGMGCSPFQAKKVQGALFSMGIGAAPSAPASPNGFATGVPTAFAVPPPVYAAPPPVAMPTAYVTTVRPVSRSGSRPSSPGKPSKESQELAELKAQVAREALKNDLRKDMDSAARLAAVEAVQRSGGSGQPSSPVVINNNNNNNSTAATTAAAAAAPAAAPAGAVMVAPTAVVAPALVAPRAPAVLYHEQRYCGPISWIIGLFLFPCICCCPIDRRKVPAMVL